MRANIEIWQFGDQLFKFTFLCTGIPETKLLDITAAIIAANFYVVPLDPTNQVPQQGAVAAIEYRTRLQSAKPSFSAEIRRNNKEQSIHIVLSLSWRANYPFLSRSQ